MSIFNIILVLKSYHGHEIFYKEIVSVLYKTSINHQSINLCLIIYW